MSEPTGATHEEPSQRISALSFAIASVRGSAIQCFGTMDLELRGEDGERHRILQADQSVYLYPARSHLPHAGMVVGEHDLPDVVLEVDHTTDVRRGKLWLYEEWGFPEVWVEVPDRRSPSRPAGRNAGLTIHRLEDGGYRTARESRAFPGWTANEIHMALNEPDLSATTSRILDRVGRALGARDGTGPDDMPWLRRHREQGRAAAGSRAGPRARPRLAARSSTHSGASSWPRGGSRRFRTRRSSMRSSSARTRPASSRASTGRAADHRSAGGPGAVRIGDRRPLRRSGATG